MALDARPSRTTVKEQRTIGDLRRLEEELPPLRTEHVHRLLDDVDYVTVLSVRCHFIKCQIHSFITVIFLLNS